MARPAKFTLEEMLDGAVGALRVHGPEVTIAQVSSAVGAPVGSIYHRYPSREHLLASVWLRSIRRFHEGLLATIDLADPREALLAQAVHQPRFCRAHPGDALAMSLYSQRQLLSDGPAELREDVAVVNDAIWALGRRQTRALVGRSGGRVDGVVAMAIRQTPYGMVRPYVRTQQRIPRWLDDAVLAASGAVLDLLEGP